MKWLRFKWIHGHRHWWLMIGIRFGKFKGGDYFETPTVR